MATYRRSYVFRLASDPVCRLWTGIGRLPTPADDVDPSGAIWGGAGALLQIPALKALINGIADRVRFTLSGASAETLRLALEDRDSVYRAEVRIGWVAFDADWQVDGAIHWDWIGIADVLEIESAGDAGNRSRSIALSVAAADTRRTNPNYSYYTAASQRLRSPDDAFCDQVAAITLGVKRRFAPK